MEQTDEIPPYGLSRAPLHKTCYSGYDPVLPKSSGSAVSSKLNVMKQVVGLPTRNNFSRQWINTV